MPTQCRLLGCGAQLSFSHPIHFSTCRGGKAWPYWSVSVQGPTGGSTAWAIVARLCFVRAAELKLSLACRVWEGLGFREGTTETLSRIQLLQLWLDCRSRARKVGIQSLLKLCCTAVTTQRSAEAVLTSTSPVEEPASAVSCV